MRGRFHQVAFMVSIPAGSVLVAAGRTTVARVSTAVYAVSLSALYGVSAAYHRLPWSPKARLRMKRLDHSAIFVLIAGSYTPICLLVLHGWMRIAILAGVWAGAAAGVAIKLAAIHRTRLLGVGLYIGLGWVAVVALPQTLRGLSPAGIALMAIGGVLYTGGAIVYATRRPDPNPRVFGFHEVWHSAVVMATACHYAMIMLIALSAR